MNFVDIIGDVVSDVRAEYDPTHSNEPYYLYGHPLEIFNILSEKDQIEIHKDLKYPLIALFQDFEEDVSIIKTVAKNITIVIMTETSMELKADQRYIKTFTPVLIPIYDLFIEHLKESIYVSSELYEHTKIDRLYWGKEDTFGNMGNIGNDKLDAIVIKNLDLEIIQNC